MKFETVAVSWLLLAGCPAGDDETGDSAAVTTTTGGVTDSTSAAESSTTEPSTTGDPCAGMDLPLCDLCPAARGTLCGAPCETPGQSCSNEIGDGMDCVDGTWQCAVHPPLGMGCNLVCSLAEACTEIGCSDGLTVSLRPDGDGVTAGSYAVSLDADGVLEDCTLEISTDPGVCLGGPPCVPATTCNALVLLTQPEPSIDLQLAVASQVTVTVQRDAEPPVVVTESPSYAIGAPNGPGCPPACAMAQTVVAAL
jgi:hypothetical protein